jgi:hypothetical protein
MLVECSWVMLRYNTWAPDEKMGMTQRMQARF